MLISTTWQANNIAAQNMDTLIVLPKRQGVEIRISYAMWSQLLTRRTRWWSRAWPRHRTPGSALRPHLPNGNVVLQFMP